MKTVYFVRHGESEANEGSPIFQGESSKLTAKGRTQAQFIAERCRKLDFETIIASSAVRAQDTAKYISERTGKRVETEASFTERKLPSELLGESRYDIKAKSLYEKWEQGFFKDGLRAGTGENFEDLKERAGFVLDYLAKRAESSLLVVCHGFLLRMIISRIVFGESLTIEEFTKILQAFRTSNTGLTLVEYMPSHGGTVGLPAPMWLIRVWNDHAHLG